MRYTQFHRNLIEIYQFPLYISSSPTRFLQSTSVKNRSSPAIPYHPIFSSGLIEIYPVSSESHRNTPFPCISHRGIIGAHRDIHSFIGISSIYIIESHPSFTTVSSQSHRNISKFIGISSKYIISLYISSDIIGYHRDIYGFIGISSKYTNFIYISSAIIESHRYIYIRFHRLSSGIIEIYTVSSESHRNIPNPSISHRLSSSLDETRWDIDSFIGISSNIYRFPLLYISESHPSFTTFHRSFIAVSSYSIHIPVYFSQ